MSNSGDMNFYKVLGVEPSATNDEIQKSYKKLLKKYDGDFERQLEVGMARSVLLDPAKRQEFDAAFFAPREVQSIPVEAHTGGIFETQTARLNTPVATAEYSDEAYHRHDHHHYVHQQSYQNSWTGYIWWFMIPMMALIWIYMSLITSH